MSETTNEPDETGQSDESVEAPETGMIADEELPEDLQPDKNPLARNPDEESGAGDPSGDDSTGGGPQVDGMPDMGDPGATT
jgi:hypothetical protein